MPLISPGEAVPLFPGSIVEVLDAGRWEEAEIVSVDQHGDVEVHFLYWGAKYDQVISFSEVSKRIARKGTHCYYEGGVLKARQCIHVYDEDPTQQKWATAYVIDEDEDRVKVHFKGFSSKFDEWLSRDSERIAPFCHKTKQPTYVHKCNADKGVVMQPSSMENASFQYGDSEAISGSRGIVSQIEGRGIPGSNSGASSVFMSRRPTAGLNRDRQHKRMIPKPAARATYWHRYVEALLRRSLRVRPMQGDGNCLFRTISHQMYGTPEHYNTVRQRAMDYIEQEREFFEPSVTSLLRNVTSFEGYITHMRRDGVWGDEPQIQALCEIYDRRAEIFTFDRHEGAKLLRTFHNSGSLSTRVPLRLSYYGGGHYDSIEWDGQEEHYIRTPCGEFEEMRLHLLANRRNELQRRLEVSGPTGAETVEIEAALAESRRLFDAEGDLDAALSMSLDGFDGWANVEGMAAQQSILDESRREHEQSELERALAMSVEQTSWERQAIEEIEPSAEEQMLQHAIAQSMGVEESLASPQSNQDNEIHESGNGNENENENNSNNNINNNDNHNNNNNNNNNQEEEEDNMSITYEVDNELELTEEEALRMAMEMSMDQ